LIDDNFHIVRSERMAEEGEPVAETSTNYIVDSLHVSPTKEEVDEMKGRV